MHGERASPELARRLLEETPPSRDRPECTVAQIIDATAASFGVAATEVLARGRRPTVTRARKLAMYLARELTDHSLPEIGRAFGGRDHSTVLSAVRGARRDIEADPQLAAAVDSLRTALDASS
jgi:chromosomal replication initiator protein